MIKIAKQLEEQATLLSNTFIDDYMPQANGEFVKIYIFLLRALSGVQSGISMEELADRLQCTEKDILRALRYWQKEGLVTITMGPGKVLESITLLELPKKASVMPEEEPEMTGPRSAPVPGKKSGAASSGAAGFSSPDAVKDAQNSEELRQLLFAAEHLLGKPMTPSEVQKILYFHDTLAMSPDLIEFLVEYCVSKNHKSLRYMEKVALSWNEAGITTVAMAREQSSAFKSEYFSVLRFLGITGRSPVKDETAYIDRWLDQYGFDLELIREACSRTILKTGQPSFQYTDRILTDWHAQNVHTLGDIQNADETFRSTKKETAPPKKQPSTPSRNRFNNFHQRQYDFQEYEKRLLSGQTVQGENGDT